MNGDGIFLSAANTTASIRNTTSRGNGGSGIRLPSISSGTINVVLDAVVSEQNGGNGLETGSGAIARVRGGSYASNAGAGVAILATQDNSAGVGFSVTGARHLLGNGGPWRVIFE